MEFGQTSGSVLVTNASTLSSNERRPGNLAKVLAEALVVAFLGAMFAFIANSLSPRGLNLARNYFPTGTNGLVSTPIAPGIPAIGSSGGTNESPEEQAIARLKEKGLEVIRLNEVVQLFHDPRFQQQMIVFVDARNDEHYREGHIPGAYQLDPYHPENYLGSVLPACQIAQEVVVYCTGGDCEDSEIAAMLLRDAGIAVRKLRVYVAGITDWKENHLPLETSERNSGKIEGASQ